jgi:Lrp/AsnC family transcriptional regulator, leucine-responsive regulatory protein
MATHRPKVAFADGFKVNGSVCMDKAGNLDETDFEILGILQSEGRLAFAELGRRVGLSQPAISERVSRLEECGVITGYSALIDPRALGLGLTAIIRLQTSQEQVKSCIAKFDTIPNITEIHRVTGVDCYHLTVQTSSTEELEQIVDKLAAIGGVTTCVVLKSQPRRTLTRAFMKAAKR